MGLKEGLIGGLIIWGLLGGIEITIYLITIIIENNNQTKSLSNCKVKESKQKMRTNRSS
jgi:hypothetical protein